MDPIHGLDWGTYYFFRNQRLAGTIELEAPMRVGMALGSYWVLGSLALLIFLAFCRHAWLRGPAMFALVTAAALTLGEGLKRLVARPRPPDAELWLSQSEGSFSFPSTSALLSSFLLLVLAMTWGPKIPEPGWRSAGYVIGVAVVLYIGTSQLYLGLHFVTDLLAGWTAGTLLALVLAGLLTPKANSAISRR